MEYQEYERQEWNRITPGCFRLAIYWLQTLCCALELPLRILYHGIACLMALPFYELAVLHLQRQGVWSTDMTSQQNFDKVLDVQGRDAQYYWPVLPWTQLEHHSIWFMMFFNYFPPLIQYNLTHPCTPFFVDGSDITIYRPRKPKKQFKASELCPCCPSEKGGSCCDCCCCGEMCDQSCDNCCLLTFAMGIRYMRSSFVGLSGYHALQCGTLCGPCVRCACYDPCVGGNTERGCCRLCEVDEIRSRRWLREDHVQKLLRTRAFFDAHPHLLRPTDEEFTVAQQPDPRIMRAMEQALSQPPQQASMEGGSRGYGSSSSSSPARSPNKSGWW
mmetsp:Transcript_107383/g.342299  ORF Transcript_107383/g.342299 Transcript_107383/m.342299 type:complete len:330 (-) Transcript_107383:1-990(-)